MATAMATVGLLAGAKAIIQSVVSGVPTPGLGGSGLGRHVVRGGEADARRRPERDHLDHEAGQRARRGLRGGPVPGGGLVLLDQVVLRVADLVHDVRGHDHAAVGDPGRHQGHLQGGGDRAVLADGREGQEDLGSALAGGGGSATARTSCGAGRWAAVG